MAERVLTADQVREIVRSECQKAGSAKAWAEAHEISRSILVMFLRGERPVTWTIERALKLERVYRLDGSRNAR